MSEQFPTDHPSILRMMEEIDPVAYAQTRNYLNGKVSHLSPYISRGVMSLKQIKEFILNRYSWHQSEKFIQELAWREYWQRTWEAKADGIFTDLKQPQQYLRHDKIPRSVMEARTGINIIDKEIRNLVKTGYMHNHIRMYLASITCNIGGAHWLQPSRWLYYHLLDGDLASNSLSWQWVAGANASKKYYCNQDNVNHYTKTFQKDTFIDKTYEELPGMDIPEMLTETGIFQETTTLPPSGRPDPHTEKIFLYNNYQLDPEWHKNETGSRVLLLEPEHFNRFPVSNLVISFILKLSDNIPGISIFCGSFEELKAVCPKAEIIFKKHPAFTHYRGTSEDPDFLFPAVNGYFPSFSAYWKKTQRMYDL